LTIVNPLGESHAVPAQVLQQGPGVCRGQAGEGGAGTFHPGTFISGSKKKIIGFAYLDADSPARFK